MVDLKLSPVVRQIIAMSGCGFNLACQMTIWALSSLDFVNKEKIILTSQQLSWFGSLPLLLAMILATPGGMLTEYFGPRRLQLIVTPVVVFSYLAMLFASLNIVQSLDYGASILLATRVLQAIASALMLQPISPYLCEIADSKYRGISIGLIDFFSYIGYSLCYLLSYFLHWTTLMWILPLTTALPGFVLLCMSPESPVSLVKHGKMQEAKEALIILLGEEKAEKVFSELEESVRDKKASSHTWSVLSEKRYWRPLVIAALMLVFKELAGNTVVFIYLVKIFKSMNVTLHPSLSSTIVGCVRIFSVVIGVAIVQRFPRKTLLFSGTMAVAVANFVLGVVDYYQSHGAESLYLKWIPLIMLILFSLGYGIGIGTVSWIVSAEILPNAVRTVGCGITNTAFSATCFFTTISIGHLNELIGLYGVFWMYSLSAIVYVIFTAFFVPETRGRTLTDMEALWEP